MLHWLLVELSMTNSPSSEHNLLYDLSVGQIVGLILTLAAVAAVFARFRKPINRMGDMADDWFGTAARPGVKAKPGVMQRLDEVENRLNEHITMSEPLLQGPMNHAEVLARLSQVDAMQRMNSGRLDAISAAVHSNTRHILQVKGLLNEHILIGDTPEDQQPPPGHLGPADSGGNPAE